MVVNRKNAISLLTVNQKYYGENLYISTVICGKYLFISRSTVYLSATAKIVPLLSVKMSTSGPSWVKASR